MLTVNEVSRLTGVSVRSLHHYDAIGLLKPAKVTEAGYRLYGDDELKRLQNILLFRELQFPLQQIRTILDSPDFDQREALAQQIRLLELQLAHTQKLISFARRLQEEGVETMDMKAFDAFEKEEMKQYEEEVRRRWGDTAAYGEYQQKAKGRTDAEQAEIASRLMAFITEHYYQCTDEILHGLGEMYAGDERMKRNIDKAGGEGTAAFVSQAVALYCARE